LPSLIVLLPAWGCGVETYERRLAETNEYFQYINKLDTALAGSYWEDATYGIKFRPPKEFVLMAPPPAPVEGEPPPPDERQPLYLGTELPGLIAAFRGDLPASDGQAVGFLYVLGNHERILIRAANDGVGDDPATYLDDLELLLANTLGVTITPGRGDRDNEKFDVTIPMERKYAVPKEFTALTLLPPQPIQAGGQEIQLRLQLYEYPSARQRSTVPIQVALLMVYPTTVRADPVASLKLALETLTVSDQAPRLERPGQQETGGTPQF
jgi:hypothetical protein